MADPEENDDRARHLALVLMRYEKRLSQGDFARRAGIAASQYSEYDRGERPIPRRLLERAAEVADFPPILLDALLREVRSFRAAARGWSSARGVLADAMLTDFLEISGSLVETVLGTGHRSAIQGMRPPSAEDREAVPQLWACLEKLGHEQRLAVVEELEEYQTWALCERLAAESIEEAASLPAEALKLALLSRRIAELVSGPEPWRLRLRGYAGVHVSNARRANNNVPAADADFGLARKLWESGAPGDPGLLNESMIPWIEATLRKVQRRFPEALRRIDEALDLGPGELQAEALAHQGPDPSCGR